MRDASANQPHVGIHHPTFVRRGVLGLLAGLLALACVAPGEPFVAQPPGSTWYTQYTLRHERNRFRTTNYRRGLLLPINTQVTLLSMTRAEIVVRVEPSGQKLVIENTRRHTNESVEEAFVKLLAEAPVDLGVYGESERAAIMAGSALEGMQREAVIAALGYPPAIGTPTLAANRWKYWDSRFTTFFVHFGNDGRVNQSGR